MCHHLNVHMSGMHRNLDGMVLPRYRDKVMMQKYAKNLHSGDLRYIKEKMRWEEKQMIEVVDK